VYYPLFIGSKEFIKSDSPNFIDLSTEISIDYSGKEHVASPVKKRLRGRGRLA